MNRAALALVISVCAACAPNPVTPIGTAAHSDTADDPLATVQWIHGSANCAQNQDPPLQVFKYDADTYILRQNKCINYEGPFLYLLFGEDRALLEDTGATRSATLFPVGDTVTHLVDEWAAAHGKTDYPLVVAHTHAHGDHVLGDSQFTGRPRVTLVQPTLDAVTAFFGFDDWPATPRTFDLGGRTLEVLPIPGHEATHIAIWDPHTTWLLTGDTLYPGRLYIDDWDAYKASVARLDAFAHGHAIAHVMGTHIEMTQQPGVDFPFRSTYQPDEHPLPLALSHLDLLQATCDALGDQPERVTKDDFILYPF
jgi:glyoxylase-like metal-dependent hydrolase (beta-lactamase superfamily II)